MATKKFEINLTPQNDEWVKLIPNPSQNMNNLFNKLIDASIDEGLFLEVVAQSLTVPDLAKFKTAYSKLQTKRAEHIADLEMSSGQIERRKTVVQPIEEEVVPTKKETKKTHSHGFTEDSF